jgi:hypothetical protein
VKKNPFPKSNKYEELLKIYSEIAKDGCYTIDGKFVPPTELFGMSGQEKFREILKKLFDKYHVKNILDYGAGQGSWEKKINETETLKSFLNVNEIYYFEPARKMNKKTKSECVVSFDVLEHVFISDIPWVLFDIFSYSSKLVVLNVACYKAVKVLPNKENVHITVRNPFWWKGMIDGIANLFPDINYVLLASKAINDVTLFEDISSKGYLKVDGYMALEK